MMMRQNEDSPERQHAIRVLALRAKFEKLLDLIAGSEHLLSKLEKELDKLILEAQKERRLKLVQTPDSPVGSEVSSTAHVTVLRDGEQNTVREVKQRRCGNCQQLGHYRTGCPLLKKQKK